jgi:uncharacterized protein YceH (UPF0502 family)
MCTLLLRGPQTAGELRTRSERMFRFGSLQDLEQCLHDLETDPAVLVSLLAQRPGQKGRRYVQNLSARGAQEEGASPHPEQAEPSATTPLPERVLGLESQVRELEATVSQLREDFAAFRKEFE